MTFTHVVATPFYVKRTLGAKGLSSLASPQWLDARVKLFEAYCLPTVLNQTSQNFEWIMFFDPATPADTLSYIRKLIAGRKNIHVDFCDLWSNDHFVESIRKIKPDADWVVTTRLDNDDGWHENFVQWLQDAVVPGKSEVLNFPHGYIVSQDKVYFYNHNSNAFISMSESIKSLKTVLVRNHEQLSSLAPLRQIRGEPAFFQMVHGGNYSNKIRGKRVARVQAARHFGNLHFATTSASKESDVSIILENLLYGSLRSSRDILIKLYKLQKGRVK